MILIEGIADSEESAIKEFREHPSYAAIRAIADDLHIPLRVSAHKKGAFIPAWILRLWYRRPKEQHGQP